MAAVLYAPLLYLPDTRQPPPLPYLVAAVCDLLLLATSCSMSNEWQSMTNGPRKRGFYAIDDGVLQGAAVCRLPTLRRAMERAADGTVRAELTPSVPDWAEAAGRQISSESCLDGRGHWRRRHSAGGSEADGYACREQKREKEARQCQTRPAARIRS